jgi:hypothetical protein
MQFITYLNKGEISNITLKIIIQQKYLKDNSYYLVNYIYNSGSNCPILTVFKPYITKTIII